LRHPAALAQAAKGKVAASVVGIAEDQSKVNPFVLEDRQSFSRMMLEPRRGVLLAFR